MGMVFQDPLTALTPHMRVGEQIAGPLRRHLGLSRAEAWARACRWLERVRLPDAARRIRQYPHELSGGMRQRVMIAAAMACEPRLLIADEPTTALDVTLQAEVLDLMANLRDETGAAMVLITHDMGVIARLADRVCVMRAGEIVEEAPVQRLFAAPREAYTRALLAATPRLDREGRDGRPEITPPKADAAVVVEARDIRVAFPFGRGLFRGKLQAVDGVSLQVRRGETLGVVGESGSGKSTLARAILRLLPAGGAVSLLGRDLSPMQGRALQGQRRDLQVVFQDPLASLDPRMTVGDSVAEPLRVFRPGLDRRGREAACRTMMEAAGLSPELINRYPHELSGGQNQRAGIARAMILQPALVICDEAVSALDVQVRAQIIDLLIDLQGGFGMAMIFITHDLAVVRELCHRVLVLRGGRVIESASREALFAGPRHAYTQGLLAASPIPDPAQARVRRPAVPAPMESAGALAEVAPGHWVRQ
jgi:ABC-type microcin C transport system duplicated ATPase subunit YejF